MFRSFEFKMQKPRPDMVESSYVTGKIGFQLTLNYILLPFFFVGGRG